MLADRLWMVFLVGLECLNAYLYAETKRSWNLVAMVSLGAAIIYQAMRLVCMEFGGK